MRKRKVIISVFGALFFVLFVLVVFNPVIDVNVVFSYCLNADELATVFQGTSFITYQFFEVTEDSGGGGVTSNSELFGNPLNETELNAALNAEQRSAGIIVLDGSVSFIDMAKIKRSEFVDTIIVYFPILDKGDRDIVSMSTLLFFEKHPEAHYWE